MAFPLLLRPTLRSPLALGLGFTAAFATHQAYALRRPLLCDSSPAARVQDTFRTYSDEARVPVFRHGRPNPAAYRQLSAGSILGMWGWMIGEWVERGTRGLLYGARVAWRSSCEHVLENAGTTVWATGFWGAGTESPRTPEHRKQALIVLVEVRGIERIKYIANEQNSAICKGN